MRATARLFALPALLLASCLAFAGPVEDAGIAVAMARIDVPRAAAPAAKADPFAAVGRLVVPVPGTGASDCGSATIVGPRRADGRWDVLTALHCCTGSQGTLTLKDGRQVRVSVRVRDRRTDLCWMVTDEAGLDLPYAVLAVRLPERGRKVWHCGYGPNPAGRKVGAYAEEATTPGRVVVNVPVGHGDSGGGVFDEDGALVGVVSAGPEGPPEQVRPLWCGSCLAAAQLRPDAPARAEAKPEAPKAPARAPCSAACTCGCNAGGPCDCNAPRATPRPAPTIAPPARCAPGG